MKRDVIQDLNEKIKAKAKYYDECDATTYLVERFFDPGNDACQQCVYFLELSETCECLEDGMAECCPELPILIEDEIRSAKEDLEGCYGPR